MCRSHQTRQWNTYTLAHQATGDHLVSPWRFLLPDRLGGPHVAPPPDGSYSLLAVGSDEVVAKVFIMEAQDPLPTGVYIGLRSHSLPGGIGARTAAELRLWDPAFTADPECSPYFVLMHPTTNSIGFTPQQDVCFAYFLINPDPPPLAWLTELTRFLERCRQQYG